MGPFFGRSGCQGCTSGEGTIVDRRGDRCGRVRFVVDVARDRLVRRPFKVRTVDCVENSQYNKTEQNSAAERRGRFGATRWGRSLAVARARLVSRTVTPWQMQVLHQTWKSRDFSHSVVERTAAARHLVRIQHLMLGRRWRERPLLIGRCILQAAGH